jgi:hypothetical protein
MSRFRGTPPPAPFADLVDLYREWGPLKGGRQKFDAEIVGWAEGLASEWLVGTHTHVSPSLGREVTTPRWLR